MVGIFHETSLLTRYCESDALGHINSVSYFIYLEQARVEFFLENEIVFGLQNWPFILASTHCDYKRQIYINDKIVIQSFVKNIGSSSFTLGHDFYREGEKEKLAYGEAVIVHFDFNHQKSSPIPPDMFERLVKFTK